MRTRCGSRGPHAGPCRARSPLERPHLVGERGERGPQQPRGRGTPRTAPASPRGAARARCARGRSAGTGPTRGARPACGRRRRATRRSTCSSARAAPSPTSGPAPGARRPASRPRGARGRARGRASSSGPCAQACAARTSAWRAGSSVSIPSTPTDDGTAVWSSSFFDGLPQARRPLGPVVDLDEQRQARVDERPQVVDRRVFLRHADRLEARADQLPLHRGGVRDEQVDVAEPAQLRLRVPRGDLRPFHEYERAVARLADALEQDGRDEREDRGRPAVGLELVRDGPSDLAERAARPADGRRARGAPPPRARAATSSSTRRQIAADPLGAGGASVGTRACVSVAAISRAPGFPAAARAARASRKATMPTASETIDIGTRSAAVRTESDDGRVAEERLPHPLDRERDRVQLGDRREPVGQQVDREVDAGDEREPDHHDPHEARAAAEREDERRGRDAESPHERDEHSRMRSAGRIPSRS